MEFQRRKLRLSLSIISIGLIVALIWHGIMGWHLGCGYPLNTFLFKKEYRYGDFIQCLGFASMPGLQSNYFPSAYFIFYPFLGLPFTTAAILFLNACLVTLYLALNEALRSLVPDPRRRVMACTVFLWSYPILYALDRANIEILLVALVGVALLLYSRKKFAASFLVLLPAICFKLYPAILLLLFRRRLYHWVFLGTVGFIGINLTIMLALPDSLITSLGHILFEMGNYTRLYIIGQRGVSNSTSAWNFYRICVWTVYSLLHHHFTWPMPLGDARTALSIYYKIFMVVLALVTFQILLVESTFARRAVLLLLYLTVSAPGAGEYKLAFLDVALVIFILIPERRPWDMLITIALALCLIPKREVILTFCGLSDSNFPDASLGVILNPLCTLTALALLMRDGWRTAAPFNWRRRLAKFGRIICRPKLAAILFPPAMGPSPRQVERA